MALEAVVDSLDSVPEAVRSEYKEVPETGKFHLDVAPVGGYALEDVTGLKSALGAERGSVSTLKSQLAAFADMDPADIQAKLGKLAELEAIDPAKEADKLADTKAQAKIDQILSKHQKEVETISGAGQKYKGQLQKLLIDDAAKSAILAAGGNDKTVAYMLPEVKKALALRETENGEFITEVRDSAGNPRIGDAQGTALSVAGLVNEMKETDLWAGAFPGKGKSGGGRQSDNSGGMPNSGNLKKSQMSGNDKSDFISKHGLEKFNALQE